MVGGSRMKTALVGCLGILATLTMVSGAFAQDVRWNLSGPVGAGQRATLELVFEGARPDEDVELPRVEGLTVLGAPSTSSSTQMSFSSGQGAELRSTVTFAFPIRTDRQGTLTIPRFEVETDEGTVEVPGVSIVVGEPMLAGEGTGSGVPLDDIASSQLRSSSRDPYAGEVIDLDLVVSVAPGRRGELMGSPVWNEAAAIAEPWSEGRAVRVGRRSGMHFKTRAVVESAGPAVLEPVEQELAVETGKKRDPFGGAFGRMNSPFGSRVPSIFGRPEMARFLVASDPLSLDVAPLPGRAPEGFLGAVGDFRLESKLVPEHPKAGEPLTWTLSLEGTGNWPMGVALPPRAVPEDLRTIRPRIERDFAEGDLFTGRLVEDLVLIPEHEGEVLLDPVRFVYFDPVGERYETLEVQPRRLSVGPGRTQTAAATAPVALPAAKPAAVTGATTIAIRGQDAGPAALPADLLTGTGLSRAPVPTGWVVAGAGAPLAALAGYAFMLGIRRARVTDPRRAKREAILQAQSALRRVEAGGGATTQRAALLDWQLAVAVLLGLDRAAPTLRELNRLLGLAKSESERFGHLAWVELWRESDQALYSSAPNLPADWCGRAEASLAQVQRPRFNPMRGLHPRNLLPVATAVSLLMATAGVLHAEESVQALYHEGSFAEAEEVLQQQVEAAPEDWVARYNLGLVEAQLGNEGNALAETTSAFLRKPRNSAVRWNLEWLAGRIEAASPSLVLDPALRDLAFGRGWGSVARLASPFAWQAAGVLGVALFCLGVALWVRGRHVRFQTPGLKWGARSATILGVAVAGLALGSVQQYGALGDPDAAMVATSGVLRSVPTEAQSAQAQRPIAAGTVVVKGAEFLGWLKVVLPSGESGWLRARSVVPLYAAPSA